MAKADDYAKWIIDNQDKKDTEDFNTVVQAYQQAKQEESQPAINTNAPPNPVENIGAYGAQATASGLSGIAGGDATANVRNLINVAKNATQWTPNSMMQVIGHPINTAEAFIAQHPWANTPVKNIVGGVGKNIAGSVLEGAVEPTNMFTLPYNMAAYEQAKIRANPNAPQYQNNPYAMQQRGQAPTQAAAGAQNQQNVVKNYATPGNPVPGTPAFQELAKQYAPAQQAVQQPQMPPAPQSPAAPPTSSNFIARIHQLAHTYLPARYQQGQQQ